MIIDSSDPAAFDRAIRKLSKREQEALYDAIAAGKLDSELTPHERLWLQHRRRKRDAFLAWMATLDEPQRADIYRRLQADETMEAIRADFPPDPKSTFSRRDP